MNSLNSINKKKQELGFTLIELMIVVGIIGILVAVAAPNFQRYQSKARQAEAKLALSAIYAGEKAFYAEYSAYVAGMTDIGYAPEGNKRFYTVGWSAVSNAAARVTGYSAAPSTASFARTNFPSLWTDCTLNDLSTATPAATATDAQAFLVIATGQLRDTQTTCDTWNIDDSKVVSNSAIGL